MCDLVKLSISLDTQFGENIDNPPQTNQTTIPHNTQSIYPDPISLIQILSHPFTSKILKSLFTTTINKLRKPFQKQFQMQTLHTLLETTTSIPYVETAPVIHDHHGSESSQNEILIETLIERLYSLANMVKHVEGSKSLGGLSDDDLCMYPDVELLEGYKLPNIEMFNDIGDPKSHLRTQCDKLVRVGIRRYS